MMIYPGSGKYPVADKQAENLEKKGLWRRAAMRWLAVLDDAADEKIREGAMFRRNYCQRMATKPFESQDIAE